MPCPGENLRLHPLQHNRCAETKKYGPNERPGQNSRKKKTLSDKEIDNLSDAEFKTLLIRILTKMVVYVQKIEEKVKTMQSEIKKNIKGTNSEGKETGTQINDLKKKRRNKHPTGTE